MEKRVRKDQKIVDVNVSALKERVQDASKSAKSKTGKRLKNLSNALAERARATRDKALDQLVNQGILITEKQLTTLKSFKKRRRPT